MRFNLMLQAIGAQGVLPAECKAVVKQYVPEIMKAIVTLPADEVTPARPYAILRHLTPTSTAPMPCSSTCIYA